MCGFWDRAGRALGFAFTASLVLVPMLISMAAAGLGAQRLLGHSFGVAGTTALAILAGGAAIDLLKGLCAFATFQGVRERSGSTIGWAAGFVILFLLSCLCQHATVKNLLLDAERAGTHASRGNAALLAEIQALDDQIDAIKAKGTPRPSTMISWAIKTTTVPAATRKASNDCLSPEDAFTSKACAPLRQLRAELAASEDLERLETKVSKLRKEYAGADIVAGRDPLATSFDELVAPLLQHVTGSNVRGEVGVPFLALIALEIFSCFGPTLIANRWRAAYPAGGTDGPGGRKNGFSAGVSSNTRTPEKSTVVALPVRSKRRVRALGSSPLNGSMDGPPGDQNSVMDAATTSTSKRPPRGITNILPKARQTGDGDMLKAVPAKAPKLVAGRPPGRRFIRGALTAGSGAKIIPFGPSGKAPAAPTDSLGGFLAEGCERSPDASTSAADAFAAYVVWCAARGVEPLNQHRFGRALAAAGFDRRKSHGTYRYRGLRLIPREAISA